MRAHRAFRQLALLLSRAGFHVLRFDYFGTGDSAGAGEEATIERWIEDVGTAVDELKDTADIDEVAVVGLRLGATLGAYAAAKRSDVSQLVLWDAVVRGKLYLEGELAEHAGGAAAVAGASRSGTSQNGAGAGAGTGVGVTGVMGFPFSSALLASLSRLELHKLLDGSSAETFVVVSNETPEQQHLAQALQSKSSKGRFLCVPSEGNWNEVDDFGSALIPQAIIRAIVDHLSDRVT
jgi:pimeloyl-ACP methyl ester carboxylesterase